MVEVIFVVKENFKLKKTVISGTCLVVKLLEANWENLMGFVQTFQLKKKILYAFEISFLKNIPVWLSCRIYSYVVQIEPTFLL